MPPHRHRHRRTPQLDPPESPPATAQRPKEQWSNVRQKHRRPWSSKRSGSGPGVQAHMSRGLGVTERVLSLQLSLLLTGHRRIGKLSTGDRAFGGDLADLYGLILSVFCRFQAATHTHTTLAIPLIHHALSHVLRRNKNLTRPVNIAVKAHPRRNCGSARFLWSCSTAASPKTPSNP